MTRAHVAHVRHPASLGGVTPARSFPAPNTSVTPVSVQHKMSAVDFGPPAARARPAGMAHSPNAPVQGFWRHLRRLWNYTAPVRRHPIYRGMQLLGFGMGAHHGYRAIHGLGAEENEGPQLAGPAGLAGQALGRFHHLRNLELQRQGRLQAMDHDRRLREQLERDRH